MLNIFFITTPLLMYRTNYHQGISSDVPRDFHLKSGKQSELHGNYTEPPFRGKCTHISIKNNKLTIVGRNKKSA